MCDQTPLLPKLIHADLERAYRKTAGPLPRPPARAVCTLLAALILMLIPGII